MGIFDKLKSALSEAAPQEAGKVAPVTEGKKRANVKKPTTAKKPADPAAPKPKKPRANAKKKVAEDPEKIKATKKGEPWVKVLNVDLDTEDPGVGSFELDWNDIFIARLVKAGYQGKTDADIVDNWFKAICRNVMLESWEQEMADPDKRDQKQVISRRDIGNGRTEVS